MLEENEECGEPVMHEDGFYRFSAMDFVGCVEKMEVGKLSSMKFLLNFSHVM